MVRVRGVRDMARKVLRAEVRLVNMTSAGFEPNPLLWAADGWLSQAEVTFAWSWLAQGEWLRVLLRARVDDANDRAAPRPASLRINGEALLVDFRGATRDVAR